MIGYYLKMTWRKIRKEPLFSGITILGLTIGITSFLILFLYVANEKSYDKHFAKYKNIYRVISYPQKTGDPWARSLGIVHVAAENIPEVEESTQFTYCTEGSIKIDDNLLQQNDILSVDKAFMNLFEVEPEVGDLNDIDKPNVAFITEDFAKKYFSNENPIGKSIDVEALQYFRDLGKYEIKGIVKNAHPKTHFNYEILLSQKGSLEERYTSLPNLKIFWTYNYLLLKEGASPQTVANKIAAFYNSSELKDSPGPKEYDFNLIALQDIHLKSDYRFELKESSSKINITLFVVISFVILLVSLLNFINLTIARLIKRSKELGLKRSAGAAKKQLTGQILMEVFLVCISGLLLAFIVAEGLKSFINKWFYIQFDIYYSEPIVLASIIGVLALCLILTGVFVGFFLNSKSSPSALLNQQAKYSKNFILKTLLIGQFTIVIILIAATFFVNKQMNFINQKPLGFDKENVLVINLKDFSKDPAVFMRDLETHSRVNSVGYTRQHFGYPTQSFGLEGLGLDGSAELVFANYTYLKTMNIELLKNWIKPPVDTIEGMVVNEHLYNRLMEQHGSMEALNTFQNGRELAPDQRRINIIGVARDFNYNSAHEAIGDFAFLLEESNAARFIHVRLNKGDLRTAMTIVRKVWDDHYSHQDFNYFFLDEKIASQYKAEVILGRVLSTFSLLGILISIIGISALSLFISQQKTKEIGIRKVNGAKISEILTMLNKDFVKWVVIAFIVATPVAYYAMNKWLENFAYKTGLSWWIFALAGVLALGIALITVSWQSWRAATRNPVEALRYE
ncbi:ABC transporter permease [Maribellus maritimus]|uniref:ABC transporter permease n=1 Tax=Maribellus maritimus TaxID=2870838 RepID=UPI001EECA88E|nr:ABC transporter permease [Maribellus maritimus]MCG6189908.1 ABC transporter permease [Maribellus maritimus]